MKILVYEQLPSGVLHDLERKNPPDEKWQRKHKHHQWLTQDIGNPHLEKQVAIVITLMKISSDWRKFKRNFVTAFPEQGQQLELPLPEKGEDQKDP